MAITWTLQGALKRSTDTDRPKNIRDLNVSISTEEEASFTWRIPTGTVDEQFDFGLVQDAQMVALFSDETVSAKLSPGGDPIDFEGALIIMGSALNELYLSNSSGETATVSAFIGGAVVTL